MNNEINGALSEISAEEGWQIKMCFRNVEQAVSELIDGYKGDVDSVEEEVSLLKEQIIDCKEAKGNCLIGNYNELKRVLTLNGVWNDELEDAMENIVKFNNVIE